MNEDNYLTLVFVNGTCLTRKREEIFDLAQFKFCINNLEPSGQQLLVNWDNVAYVREAMDYEITAAHLYDRKVE